jgi:dTDP-4-dehydrorhamnose 3,5-epimerase
MIYTETPLKGAFILDAQPIADERGFFAYAFDSTEAATYGLNTTVAQSKISFNHRRGTIRGMHWQTTPATETKLIRCTRGAIHDVIVDLRPGSCTFGKHTSVILSADNHRALYVPELFAHGYQALEDATEVWYQVSTVYTPGTERGIRYDDPFLSIHWPLDVTLISPKDKNWPLFRGQ